MRTNATGTSERPMVSMDLIVTDLGSPRTEACKGLQMPWGPLLQTQYCLMGAFVSLSPWISIHDRDKEHIHTRTETSEAWKSRTMPPLLCIPKSGPDSVGHSHGGERKVLGGMIQAWGDSPVPMSMRRVCVCIECCGV